MVWVMACGGCKLPFAVAALVDGECEACREKASAEVAAAPEAVPVAAEPAAPLAEVDQLKRERDQLEERLRQAEIERLSAESARAALAQQLDAAKAEMQRQARASKRELGQLRADLDLAKADLALARWSAPAPRAAAERALPSSEGQPDADLREKTRRMLVDGCRTSEIRDAVGKSEDWVAIIARQLAPEEQAARARAAARRREAQPEGEQVFKVPVSWHDGRATGHVYGRLDGNSEIVERVRRRTGLDPEDYVEGVAA